MTELERSLHLLIGRVHLDLAGYRLLTREEFALVEEIARWWKARENASKRAS